ncbi:Hypothetical protein PHPALM_12234, partial [Phytophthora palmivora]
SGSRKVFTHFATPVFDRRSFVDDICFGNKTFNGCLATLDRLLQRFTECRISVSFTKSIFVQSKVDFLSHEVSSEGIRADPKKIKTVTEVPFPTSKKGMQPFLGAFNYYSRFFQDFAMYGAALYQLKDADFAPGGDLTVARRSFASLQQKVMDAPILRHFGRDKEVHVMLFANEWALSSTLMQEHDGKLHPVRFCGRVLKDAEMNYHPAEKEILALLLLLKVRYTQLAGRPIHVYTRFSTLDWVHKSKTLFGRMTQFAVMLSPWHLVVQRVKERDCSFAPLLQAGLTSFVDLGDSLAQVAPPTRGSPSIRMDPNLLYARLPRSYQGCVLSFDGSATEKHGGYSSCAWILWRVPAWTIVTAASAYLEATTVNLAEYAGMNNGVQAALGYTTEDLVIVGDSRLAIQQSLGVIACCKESLLTHLNRHRELTAKFRSVKYLHVVREFYAAADSLASETLESKVSKVVSTETRLSELVALNRIQDVIYEPTAKAETEDKPSVNTIRAHVRTGSLHRRTFLDFVQDDTETGRLTVTTRQQVKVNEKRVRFANETAVVDRREPDSQDKANDVPIKARNHIREEQLTTEDSTSTVPSANDIDPLTVQRERRRRIAIAQDEELRWSNLKTVLRGEDSKLGYRAARDSWKMSDRFTLSEDNVLYYLGTSRRKSDRQQQETTLRLTVPSTMVLEVLQNCHDSLEGGHQGIVRTFNRIRQDYYWIGLYADVERHVRSCTDCSSSKSRPQFRGYSPGNVLAERPFQLVSMDFVVPLPNAFTGFVMGKAIADTTALCVAKAFEECVYRRFSAPTLIRHDRDPRFMSEVIQAFAEMMQSRSRATLSYRPQANGQQERSVKTVMQSVRVYAEDPLQQDWDEIAEKLIFAINNSMDATRKETPFYLVHGWDAQSTLRAMTSSLKRGYGKQTDALVWRREVNRQQEIALEMAKEYQTTEKPRRARKQMKHLQAAIPSTGKTEPLDEAHPVSGTADDTPVTAPRPLFKPGDRVWLYMKRVKPGLTKKLAHRWYGPFRVKRRVEGFAYELELPDRSGYSFYPVVHVSRLKAVNEFGSRPKSRLAPEVTEETRLDFDEELLPEDSWEPDQLAGEHEVEAILDDRVPLSTSTERAVREFKVKWLGYDEPTWEPASNLSCGGLLYDYLREKRSDRRLQTAQVADED